VRPTLTCEIIALIVASYVRLLAHWFEISNRLLALERLYVLYFLGAKELDPKFSMNLVVCVQFYGDPQSEHDTNSLEVT